MRFFNIAGPCNQANHYMVPVSSRLESLPLDRLIAQQAYFVLYAPRQTGKTTAMREWANQLNHAGKYIGVLVSMEAGAAFPHDVGRAEDAILGDWQQDIRLQLPRTLHPPVWHTEAPSGQRIRTFLTEWALDASRPLVVLLDEIDALTGYGLISVLRQLRTGFSYRPAAFPSSVCLIGLRDIRDYKVQPEGEMRLHTASPFNVTAGSFTLRDLTAREVSILLEQHTHATGQVFATTAQQQIFALTQGQPWLVNALAKVCVEEVATDEAIAIDLLHVNEARDILIQRRQTHLDQLTDKLREARLHRVIAPILAGDTLDAMPPDDLEYALDLGLVRHDNGSSPIANPMYGEIISRVLASSAQASLPATYPVWLNADGSLNPVQLLEAFLAFWRQHGQPLLQSAPYHEIAPHLVMMAFLHHVVNRHGRLEREYAIGSRRIDLCLFYGEVQMAMELKVWRNGETDPQPQGLAQLDRYLSGLGLKSGWLVLFDQRSGQPDISQRTAAETTITPAGRTVTVIRA